MGRPRLSSSALVLALLAGCGDDDAGSSMRDAASGDASTPTPPPPPGTPPGTPPTPPGTPPTPTAPTPPGTPPTPTPTPPTPTPPPPGAIEGYGAVTRGAESSPDGFEDCHVTSLADDGTGTLRDCLSEGNRRVVFDVGGTITLESDLGIRWSYITIDGSTAPAPGITILQPAMINTVVEARASTGPAHDIVIRYLRMDGQATTHENAGDLWGLDGENAPVYNVVLDHLTGIASSDGVFDIWGDVQDVTLSWSLIYDTVTALHMSTDDLAQPRRRISVHHNVFARNNERQVRLRHDSGPIDFVNNVVYGWGWFEGGGYGLGIVHDPGEANPSVSAVANVFHFVPDLFGDPEDAIVFDEGADRGAVYFEGNIVPEGESDQDMSTSGPFDVPEAARVTVTPADVLGTVVVPNAGTHYPTAAEQELLSEIASAI